MSRNAEQITHYGDLHN